MAQTTLADLRAALHAGQRLIERGTVSAGARDTWPMARLICEMFDLNPEVSHDRLSDFAIVHGALTEPQDTAWAIAQLRKTGRIP